MGVMRFLVPRRERLPADVVERVYLSGPDEIPWRSRAWWTDQILAVERAESDSGNLFVPCAVEGHGELMLSTASLMERDEPYHLEVELARGTLNRLRNQLGAWEALGMKLPGEVRAPLAAARAPVVGRHAPRRHAGRRGPGIEAIGAALSAIDAWNSAYVAQALAARHQQGGKLGTLLGVKLGSGLPSDALARKVLPAFNTAVVPLAWRDVEAREDKRDWSASDRQIEWCRSHGLKVASGPLVAIDKWSLPDWMYLWGEDERESFRACVAAHVEAVVSRYRGKVQLWQCAARLNVANDFEQDDEERLRLAVIAIETIRRVDPRAPVVITIDQPWGSFISREDCELPPLHFADALVRAELGLAGIGLEINVGYAPHGSEPRDVLEFGRQLDRWSTLGLPLLVSLVIPSSQAPDPLAQVPARPIPFAAGGALSPETQRAWAEKLLGVLLAKQPVQAVIWNQLSDAAPHRFAHGGLVDAAGRAKPIVESLLALRREHLA